MSGTSARSPAATYNTRLRVAQDAAAARLTEAQGQVMIGISAGSRVWVKEDDEVQFGVIETIATTAGYFTSKGSMVIVMDDGRRVLATTMAARGTAWDVVNGERKEEPA